MSGWRNRKLGEVCEVLDSLRRPITKRDRVSGPFPYYGATGIVDHVGDFIFDEKLVLVGEDGAKWDSGERTAFIVEGKCWVNNHAHVLRPMRDVMIDEWLTYYLTHLDLAPWVGGLTVPKLNQGSLREIPIPLPPLAEQKRIVAILDEAFESIAKATASAERNLANANELFDAVLRTNIDTATVGAPLRTLAEVSKQFGRGKSRHRPRNDPALYGGPYPFIQTGDVRNAGHYITEFTQTYSEVGLRQSKLWSAGTICITIAANIAETGVLTFDACFPDSVIGIVVDEDFANSDYVEYVLQYFRAHLKAQGKGSAQDNINLGTFENARFPFPKLNVQNDIVSRLNMLDEQTQKLFESYTARISTLAELQQSLLFKAFSGQLTGKEAIAA